MFREMCASAYRKFLDSTMLGRHHDGELRTGLPAWNATAHHLKPIPVRHHPMTTDFIRTGELKNIASYPKWLQDVVKDCEDTKTKIIYHPLCVAMKEATLDIESTHRFLIGFF